MGVQRGSASGLEMPWGTQQAVKRLLGKVSQRQRAAEAPRPWALGQALAVGWSGAAAAVCPTRQRGLQLLPLVCLRAARAVTWCSLSCDCDAGIEPTFLSGLPLMQSGVFPMSTAQPMLLI